MSLYVEVQYRGDWWGEDPLTETRHETTGDLFRALAGKDRRYPWEALGRCTGRMYVDGSCNRPDGHDGSCGRFVKADHALQVTGWTWCESKVARQVGWVFVARNPEPVNRGDTQPTGLREAWVTVHEAPPTVTTTMHYAAFG